jgi:urease accessory protein
VVQKPLYPEGPRVCHAILVHPPSGMAGGDTIDVAIAAGGASHALITTPGATKWYRSAGRTARQSVRVDLADEAVLEWLPQEAIVYDGALACTELEVALAPRATFVGFDVLCLGRTASGERFRTGTLRLRTRIERAGELLWLERGEVTGGGALLASPVGLDGQPVAGTLLAASPGVTPGLVAACREVRCEVGRGAVTLLPGLIVARWLGPACEPAKAWLARIWACLRPALAGRAAIAPRIWNT